MPVQAKSRKPLSPEIGAIVEFIEGEDQSRRAPILFTRTVLGRKYGDVLIRDLKVSSTHVALEFRKGTFWVVDLGSSNGTFLHGEKIRETPIEPGDEVRVGLTTFKLVLDPALWAKLAVRRPAETVLREGGLTGALQADFLEGTTSEEPPDAGPLRYVVALDVTAGPLAGRRFVSGKEQVLLGRAHADVNLGDADVSRKHALVERQEGGQIVLRDLGSRNGTFVNGKKITNCVLARGDRIRLGSTTLKFELEEESV